MRRRTFGDDVKGYARVQAYLFLGVFFGLLPLIAGIRFLWRSLG